MKNIELINALREYIEEISPNDDHIEVSMNDFIEEILKNDPNGLVALSNGECEQPGIYAPKTDDGIDLSRSKPFREGEAFPDDNDWIHVGYIRIEKHRNPPLGF